MLHENTLSEIETNTNTGIEYEIALFYKLIKINKEEQIKVLTALNKHSKAKKINEIIEKTDESIIEKSLNAIKAELLDISFETQNDDVGPADIVMYVKLNNGIEKKIGLSVKYANTCTLNVTGKKFITEEQINNLKEKLSEYTDEYIKEMDEKYGDIKNWFRERKPSNTTNKFIDLIRNAVIENWNNIKDKFSLLSILFHENSPIEFWVVNYGNNGYDLNIKPPTIEKSKADSVIIKKYETSYIGFYLDDVRIAKMQVKFNNGFIERCTKKNPDISHKGQNMTYGKPFSSWNFNTEK